MRGIPERQGAVNFRNAILFILLVSLSMVLSCSDLCKKTEVLKMNINIREKELR